MAGDWIKVEEGTPDKPEIAILARKLGVSQGDAFLNWFKLYRWAGGQTRDGTISHISGSEADALAGAMPGTCAALASAEVGWVTYGSNGSGMAFSNWERHNSQAAKVRAKNADLQRVKRASLPKSDEDRERDHIPKDLRVAVYERDDCMCRYCGWHPEVKGMTQRLIGMVLSIDHVVPQCQGGPTVIDNLVTSCSDCNRRKNGRTPEQANMVLSPVGHYQKVMKRALDERRREEIRSSKVDRKTIGSASAERGDTQSAARVPSSRSTMNGSEEDGSQLEPFDLTCVDWGRAIGMAESAARRVPPRTIEDRRAWLRFGVLADVRFNEAWIIGAAEAVIRAGKTRRTRQAHFVGVLKGTAAEQFGVNEAEFISMLRRIEIPNDVWQSQVLEVRQ